MDGEPHILWETNKGRGFSSIAVQGDYLYCTGNKASQDTVYCLQVEDAQVVWTYSYPCRAGNYPGPRSTPAVDKNFVYTMSRDGPVFCLNKHNGEEIWQTDVFIEFAAQFPFWGFASSPIIKEDYLILNVCEHRIVLNKQTGQVVWEALPRGVVMPPRWYFNTKEWIMYWFLGKRLSME